MNFLFATTLSAALRLNQPPIQRILLAMCQSLQRPKHEDNNLRPSSSQVKNMYTFTSTANVFYWLGA
jgi:hypothetical protein